MVTIVIEISHHLSLSCIEITMETIFQYCLEHRSEIQLHFGQ